MFDISGQAIAVSAEGCQEYIRTKYLPHMLQMLGQGIRHAHHTVRNAALYMLGQEWGENNRSLGYHVMRMREACS